MDVTVAICTWNRAKLLAPTLDRLRQLTIPPGLAWELVVVDNNCTDDTPAVLKEAARHLPLRSVTEAQQGHSHARNRAVAEARAPLLVWTDDDVLAHPDWLANLVQAAADYPDAAFLGGPIRPWYEVPPPAWVAANMAVLGPYWALIDYGPEVRRLTAGEYAWGANLAFRTEVVRRHPFDPAYGRVKEQLSRGDETRAIDAVRAAGGYGVWGGTAAVDHFLPADRMTPAYVRQIAYWDGYREYEPFAGDRSPRLLGAPRWLWRKYLSLTARRRLRAAGRGPAWVAALRDEAQTLGLIGRMRAEARPR